MQLNLLWVLIIIFVLFALIGNPMVGPRFYSGYSLGYWPGGLGLVVVIILILFLVGRL